MKTIKDIKPKEIKSGTFDISIPFTNDSKYGNPYINLFVNIKVLNGVLLHIRELSNKNNNYSYDIRLSTFKWLYDKNKFDKNDKRKLRLIFKQLKNTYEWTQKFQKN